MAGDVRTSKPPLWCEPPFCHFPCLQMACLAAGVLRERDIWREVLVAKRKYDNATSPLSGHPGPGLWSLRQGGAGGPWGRGANPLPEAESISKVRQVLGHGASSSLAVGALGFGSARSDFSGKSVPG